MTITRELIEKFRHHLMEEEKSSATLEKYIRDVTAFFVWLTGHELDKMAVLRYKEHLAVNYAPASVNSVLSSLNSFFSYNEWHSLKVKMLKIQRQIFAERNKELTRAEYERLLKAAKHRNNKRLYFLMQTICASGIRVSELKAITVEAIRAKQATIKCKGKMRIVILPKNLCRMLTEYIKEEKITSIYYQNRKAA